MPREMSDYAMGIPKVLEAQVLKLRELDELQQGQIDIAMNLRLIAEFDVFRLSEHFLYPSEEMIEEFGVSGVFMGEKVFLNGDEDNKFGYPYTTLYGTKHKITIGADKDYTITIEERKQ